MSLKIRLRQQGNKNRQVYRLVLSESRSPRDGKYLEMLGWYNPHGKEDQEVQLYADRLQYWLNQGAILTERAAALVTRVAPQVMLTQTKKDMDARAKRCEKKRLPRRKKRVTATA